MVPVDPAALVARFATDVAFLAGPDGRLEWLSPSVTGVLGWVPDELIGQTMRDLVHPDDVARATTWRERLLGSGTTAEGGRSDPVRFRRKDGAYVWCSVAAAPASEGDGSWSGVAGTLHDVDSLVEARLDVVRSGAQLIALVDAQVEPHVLFRPVRDTDGVIVDFEFAHANKAAADFEGLSVQDLIGRRMLDVMPDREEALEDIEECRQVLASGEPIIWNEVSSPGYPGPDGQPRILDIRIAKVGVDLVSFAYRDVTGQHRDRLALAEAHNLTRAVFDSMIEPHAVFRAVRDERGVPVDFVFEDVNEAAAAFEGYPRSVLLGSTIRQLYRDPVEAGNDVADCAQVLATGLPLVANDIPSHNYTDGEGLPVYTDIRIVPVDSERVSYAWRDVSPRHRAQRLVEESEERFRMLAENMTDIVALINEGVLEWISPSVSSATGWGADELVGQSAIELVHPDDVEKVVEAWTGIEGSLPRVRYRLRRRDGGFHWVDGQGQQVAWSGGESVRTLASIRIVDAEVAALAALEELAQHDELTGLMNRHAIFAQLERSLTGPVRTGTRIAMVFCDLDGFKAVNDTYGHSAGDALLRAISRRLERSVRGGDVVSRIGGDELLIVLNGVRDLDDALRISEKLREQVRLPTPIPGGTVTVSASIGVAIAQPGESVDRVVARADRAMYEAKRSGKDRVVTIPAAQVG